MANLISRQIVESLRTGVPIREAVQLVGSGQPRLEAEFNELLKQVRMGRPRKDSGFIFFGDFGTGKSHALEFFASSAENSGFVVSRVTISRNLQLSNHRAVLSQLLAQMSTKEHREDALARILDDSTSMGSDFSEFQKWCAGEVADGNLASIYRSIAQALPSMRYGTEEFDKLLSFLAGSATQQEIKKAVSAPRSEVPPNEERTWQTIHFISNLFVHLGFNGWILLLDELELIRMIGSSAARVARGKSYASLSKWFDFSKESKNRAFATIGCMTSGFVAEIIEYGPHSWNDKENIPSALLDSASPHLAPQAADALKFIIAQDDEKSLQLAWPNSEDKERLQESLRVIYESAFDTNVDALPIDGESFESIRIYIRRWIAKWDLSRHGRKDSITINAVTQNFESDDEDE